MTIVSGARKLFLFLFTLSLSALAQSPPASSQPPATAQTAATQSPTQFWHRPFTTWTREEVDRLQRASPWAAEMYMKHGIVAVKANGRGTEKAVLNMPITVRWVSPLVMRQALARDIQLAGNRSDEYTAGMVNKDYAGIVIDVARRGDALNFPASRTITPEEEADLKKCTLAGSGAKVTPQEVFITGMYSAVARLTFPREVGGKPLVSAEDKTVTLECVTYKATFKVHFNVAAMMMNGKPDL